MGCENVKLFLREPLALLAIKEGIHLLRLKVGIPVSIRYSQREHLQSIYPAHPFSQKVASQSFPEMVPLRAQSPLELDTQGPFSLYLISSKTSSISVLIRESVSDTAGRDNGF